VPGNADEFRDLEKLQQTFVKQYVKVPKSWHGAHRQRSRFAVWSIDRFASVAC